MNTMCNDAQITICYDEKKQGRAMPNRGGRAMRVPTISTNAGIHRYRGAHCASVIHSIRYVKCC